MWSIVRITKCDWDMKWANTVEKVVLIDLLHTGLPQTFNLQKMQYLWGALKQSATKGGMPYCLAVSKMLNIRFKSDSAILLKISPRKHISMKLFVWECL